MKASIRYVNDSAAVFIPTDLLDQIGLEVGDEAEINIEHGCLVIKKESVPSYTLDELLKQCDESSFLPVE